jgi:hypothetical protein
MPPGGFEPAVRTSERSQTHALDRWATETGDILLTDSNILTLYTVGTFEKANILFFIILKINEGVLSYHVMTFYRELGAEYKYTLKIEVSCNFHTPVVFTLGTHTWL